MAHATGKEIPLIPHLETERLILRGHRTEDFPEMMQMWKHPETTRYIGDVSSAPEQVWARLLRYVGHWELLGYGYWAIEEKKSGKFIGEFGFAEVKRQLQPSILGFPELGWALHPDTHGQGYATEALKVIIQWGDAHLKERRTVAIISPENLKSIRLAQKCGYREALKTTCASKPTLLFERLFTP